MCVLYTFKKRGGGGENLNLSLTGFTNGTLSYFFTALQVDGGGRDEATLDHGFNNRPGQASG